MGFMRECEAAALRIARVVRGALAPSGTPLLLAAAALGGRVGRERRGGVFFLSRALPAILPRHRMCLRASVRRGGGGGVGVGARARRAG